MPEFSKQEQDHINQLETMDRYLIDPEYHCLRSFDGRPVMKESTIPAVIGVMAAACVICAVLGFMSESTQRLLLLAAAVFLAFYAFRYCQYLKALKGK